MKEKLIGTFGLLFGAALPFIVFFLYNTFGDVKQKETPIGFFILFTFPVTSILCPIILLSINKSLETKKKKAQLERNKSELAQFTKELKEDITKRSTE